MNSIKLYIPIRLGFLIVCALVVLGIRFFWLPPWGALLFQAKLGYYFVLSAVGIWSWCFWRFLREHGSFSRWFSENSKGLLLVVIGALLLQVHEPHLLRVLNDETSHAAGALVMHQEKAAMMPGISHYVGDVFITSQLYPAFRQYLFQVLLSLLHDFTGYRIENVFILNGLLGGIVLLVAYSVGIKIGGRVAGTTAVAMLVCLPLLAQNATSGSYDVLNLCLVGTLVYAAILYIESSEGQRRDRLNLMVYTCVLLSMARSESILYVAAMATIVGSVWVRDRRVEGLSSLTIVAPLFLLPNLMSSLFMLSNDRFLDAQARKGGQAYFDMGYLPDHLRDAVYYFFSLDSSQTNNVLASLLGGIGLVALLVHLIVSRRFFTPQGIFGWYSVWILGMYAVVLAQFWSSPLDILATRFALPCYFAAALATGWFLNELKWLRTRPLLIALVCGLWFISVSSRATSKAIASYTFLSGRGEEWLIEQTKKRDRTKTLYVAVSSVGLIARKLASVPTDRLNASPVRFVKALKAEIYQEVLIYQTYELNYKTGQWTPRDNSALDPSIQTELIAEKVLGPSFKATLVRLVGFRVKNKLITPSSNDESIALLEQFKNNSDMESYRLSLYPN